MKIEIKMWQIYMKNQKMDEEEGKMKIDSLNSMIELAANQKQTMPEDYLGMCMNMDEIIKHI